MKKKILSVIVCAAAIMSLAGCGNNEDPLAGLGNLSTPTSAATSKPASTKPAQSSASESKPASTAGQSSSMPESKPEESSVPSSTNTVDWDSVPYADELDFVTEDVDGGVKITAYLGSDTVVKVPETIDGKKVVVIRPKSRSGVFNSKVTHVKIPDSVSDIICAFYECSSLVSVNIPSSLTTISKGAFFRCSSLSSIEIPNTVTGIGFSAFAESGLESLNVPDSVKVISGDMIEGCANLKEVSLPNNILAKKDGALTFLDEDEYVERMVAVLNLSNCSSLTNTDFLKNIKPFNEDGDVTLAVDFFGCKSLTSITFPDGVQYVVRGFERCENLREITIPNSVTNVIIHSADGNKRYASDYFSLGGCSKLKRITLSDNLETLESIYDCPEGVEIVYKGKTYKKNQLPNLYKAVNGN